MVMLAYTLHTIRTHGMAKATTVTAALANARCSYKACCPDATAQSSYRSWPGRWSQIQGQDNHEADEVQGQQQCEELLQTCSCPSRSLITFKFAISVLQQERLFMNLSCKLHRPQEPTDVMVPVYSIPGDPDSKIVEMPVPVLDIHELLDYMHTELKLCCPNDKTREFWQHMRAHNVPHALGFPGTDEHCPYSLYGDEACLNAHDPKDKVTGLFLSLTLFKPKEVRQGQFLICALQDQITINNEQQTLRPILKHIVWCCNQAFEGRYPTCTAEGGALSPSKARRAGQAMACKFACAELKADWKFHERWLRLVATPTSTHCCFLCDAAANDSNLAYYQIGDGAGWAQTQCSTAGFIARKLRPGPLRLMYCNELLSHIVDCKFAMWHPWHS